MYVKSQRRCLRLICCKFHHWKVGLIVQGSFKITNILLCDLVDNPSIDGLQYLFIVLLHQVLCLDSGLNKDCTFWTWFLLPLKFEVVSLSSPVSDGKPDLVSILWNLHYDWTLWVCVCSPWLILPALSSHWPPLWCRCLGFKPHFYKFSQDTRGGMFLIQSNFMATIFLKPSLSFLGNRTSLSKPSVIIVWAVTCLTLQTGLWCTTIPLGCFMIATHLFCECLEIQINNSF